MKRQPLSIRSILSLVVGALTLLIIGMAMQEIYAEWHKLDNTRSLKAAMNISDEMFDATQNLSVERNVAYALLYAPDKHDIEDLGQRLIDNRRDTDMAVEAVIASLEQIGFHELEELRGHIVSHLAAIHDLRSKIDESAKLSMEKRSSILAENWYSETTGMMDEMSDAWARFIRHFTDVDPVVTQHLRYRHFLRIINDYSGRERSVIGRLLVTNADPLTEETVQLLRWQAMNEQGWKMARLLADQSGLSREIGLQLNDAESHYQTMYDMVKDIFYVPHFRHGEAYPIGANLWFELTTQSSESFEELRAASKKATRTYIDRLETQAWKAINVHVAMLFLALALCFYCFYIINRRVIRPIGKMVAALLDASAGKPVLSEPVLSELAISNRNDEIGKLAAVLAAFQRTSEEIRLYAHALERSNKELDDFAYIASHDLKEPLRGIHNHSRFLLEDNEDKLDEDSVSKLNRLVYLSQRMEKLVNDLLYFSRLGRQDMAIQPTDINAVIHDIQETLELFLTERHARISIPTPLPTITCDKTRVTELFRNLITNAVKYNDKPEKIVEIGFMETYAASEKPPLHGVFYVRDNGRGIPAEFYEEIFRIFKRLQSSDESDQGTGVGLTFVKKIIERHNGKIWLESTPGSGTTFYFTLKGEKS